MPITGRNNMYIQIKAEYVETRDGRVILSVPLEQNPEINAAIEQLCTNLTDLGVSKRSAYGATDDLRDALLRDAVAALVSLA